jgi:glycerol-3-phosphate acyltransferase PlsX
MRIAIDAMGGDYGPGPSVEGAVRAAARFGVPITLVGIEPQIRTELDRLDSDGLPIDIVHASQVVGMHESSPASAVRRSPDSSISRAMALVRHGEADAIVTAGHTGAVLAGAMFRLGRSRGVRRPALTVPFPTVNGLCALIDIGANADVRHTDLLQFAVMGAEYAERVLGIANPTVGLVTIGEERGKGNQKVLGALPLLEESRLNFIGNVEGRDIPVGNVDVAVTDGFTGNVLMKFAEGAAVLVHHMLREAAASGPIATLGGALLRPSLRRAEHRMDYRSYGGALLLGVRGVVVIGHGRSDAAAMETAVEVAIRAVDQDLVGATERRIDEADEAVDHQAVIGSDTARVDDGADRGAGPTIAAAEGAHDG